MPLFEAVAGATAPAPLDPEPLATALSALEGAGNLERDGERVRVPEAVRERVLSEMDYPSSLRATDQALALVLAAFPGDPGDYGSWKRSRALMPELRALIGRARELEMESFKVPLALALGSEFMTASGEFTLANEMAEEAFAYASLSLEPAVQATMNHARGVILAELGELEPARRALEQAQVLRAQVEEEGAAALRVDLLALGEVLGEMGEFEAARWHLEQVQTTDDVPVDRFDAQARRRLAWLLMEEKEFELSERAYREALEATRRLYGEEHPDTAQARGELGALLLEVSRWEDARSELESALKSACALLGDNHPAVGVIASNLGGALEGLELFEEAREAVERSLAIGHAVLPDGHRNLWLRHRKLTRILRALDEYEAARLHAESAASISSKALPPEDPEAARDQLALAALLQRMGERASARRRYEPALSILESVEDPGSPEIVGYQLTFGGLLVELGDLATARSPLAGALSNSEALDENDRVRLRIVLLRLAERLAEELAATLDLQGRDEEANRVRERDLESRRAILEEILGEERIGPSLLVAQAAGAALPDLAFAALAQARSLVEGKEDAEGREQGLLAVRLAWSSLGLDAYVSGDYHQSREFYETALELARGNTTAEGEALNDLADIASAEGDDAGAVEIYREALERMRAGKDGEVEYTLLLLGRAYKRLERYEEAETALEERLQSLHGASERRPLKEAVTLHDLADVRLARDEAEAAVELYGEAAELKRGSSTPAELATTLRALGGALREAGRLAEAVDAYAECIRLLREMSDPDPMSEAIALQEYADLSRETGDLGAAEDLFRRAIACAPLESEPLFLSRLHYGLGSVLERRGDLPGAERALRRRLDILANLEDVSWQEGITLVDLGRVREGSGDLSGAVSLYRGAVEKLADEGTPRARGFALQRLADALFEIGEDDEAVAVYEQAFEVWSEGGDIDLASRVLLDLGRAQYALDNLEAAAASFEKRIDLLGQAEEPNPRAEGFTFHDLADVRKAEGRFAEAISLYRKSIARKRKAEGGVALPASLVLLAVTLLEAGEGEEAPALADEAVAILRAEQDPDRNLLASAIALSAGPGGAASMDLSRLEEVRDLYEEDPDPSLPDLAGVKTVIATSKGLEGRKATVAREEAANAIAAALADREIAADPKGVQLLLNFALRIDDGELIAATVAQLRTLAEDPDAADARMLLIEVLQLLGRKATDDGHLGDAERHFHERLALLAERPESGPNPQGISKHDLARALGLAGRPEEAIALYREAAELKREAGNEVGVARTLFALATELRKKSDDEAREVAARSVELFREQPNTDPAELSAALGLLALLEGDDQRALDALGEAKELVESMPPDGAQVESAKRGIAKAEEAIRRRSEQPS